MTSTSQSGLESIIRRQINFANNLQSELQQINNIIAEKLDFIRTRRSTTTTNSICIR